MAEQESVQKYEVVGTQEVLGHHPGSVFEAELTEEQADALVSGGHLAKVAGNRKVQSADPAPTPAARARDLAAANVPATATEAAALSIPEPELAEEETK